MQLAFGTSGGEFIMQPATNTQGLSASNVQVYPETTYGSVSNVRPTRIGKAVLFWNRAGRKLEEWAFQWAQNGYTATDRTVLAEHISRGGMAWSAYQQQPHSVLWYGRGDGALIGLTYLPEQDVVAWHQHRLGGQYFGAAPIVESGAVIPSPDGSYDQLWLSVLRTINGTPTRTVEVMQPFFDVQPVEQAFFVDCGLASTLTYPATTITLSGFVSVALEGEPPSYGGVGAVAASAGVFSIGQIGQVLRAAGGTAIVTGYIDTQHINVTTVAPFNGFAPIAANGWSLTPALTSFSGLGHLIGETAAILGDGMVYPQQTVAGGGAVALATGASLVTAGLPYTSFGLTLPFSPARAAPAGRIKLIDTLFLRLHESVGGFHGTRTQDEYTGLRQDLGSNLEARYATAQMGASAPLYGGIQRLNPLSDYDAEARVFFGQRDPLPFTALALGIEGDVTEQAG
jgi:hypothetical protein